jgi:hypothetical protein
MVFLTCTQGRPLNFFLPQFFSFIATQLGGVHVAYLIAFSVGTVNAFLVYILLKKLNSEIIAVTATLTFCLFFRPYNAHLFNARISPANLADFPVDRKSLLPFGAMNPGIPDHSGTLLTYESPFIVFFAVPLLVQNWDRPLVRELIRHLTIAVEITLVGVAIRIYLREERITEITDSVSAARIVAKIAAAVFVGPLVSLVFVYGPIRLFFTGNGN